MTVRYVCHKDIDKEKWDSCIASSFNGIIYAYSWYLDTVCEQWDALISGNYDYVFPMPLKKKFGFQYLYQPYFSQQLGVFSALQLTEEIVNKFLFSIPKKYRLVELNLNSFNKANTPDYTYHKRITHELDLIESYENISAKYSKNTSRNIKKAKKNNLEIAVITNPLKIIELFKKEKKQLIKNIPDSVFERLETLINLCVQKGRAYIWTAVNKEKNMLAGTFFIESNNKIIYLFPATSMEGKEKGAMPFIIDSFISANSQRNLTLDFEGSNNPNIARFYKSFGSSECMYLHIKKNTLPWPIKLLKEK